MNISLARYQLGDFSIDMGIYHLWLYVMYRMNICPERRRRVGWRELELEEESSAMQRYNKLCEHSFNMK